MVQPEESRRHARARTVLSSGKRVSPAFVEWETPATGISRTRRRGNVCEPLKARGRQLRAQCIGRSISIIPRTTALRQKRSVGIRLGEPDCSVAIDNTLAKGRRVGRGGGNGLSLRASSATASHEKASVVFSLAEYQSAGCPVLLGHDTRPAWARRPLARPASVRN